MNVDDISFAPSGGEPAFSLQASGRIDCGR
jgi:hypothetical protein